MDSMAMSRCSRCGFKIPEDEEARFCPNCGAPLRLVVQPPTYAETSTLEDRLPKVSISKRFMLVAVFFAVGFASTIAGALSSMDSSEAQMILRETENVRNIILNAPEIGVAVIFGNNLIHCLFMFVPVLGIIHGVYVLYSTGRVLAAMGAIHGGNPLLLLLSVMVFPHAVMEYVAYSLALSESFWITYTAAKGGLKALKQELNSAPKMITASTVILLLAAVIEVLILLQA